MWLMLTTGALSIVHRDPKHMDESDTRTLVVRARRTEWLDEFRARWCPELAETVHDETRDYQYRAYVTPDALALAVARVTLAIDYHNFKGATQSAQHGLPDAKLRNSLHDAYSQCWTTLLNAGDGTSAYDWKNWKAKPVGIEACYKWGHWWPVGEEVCRDCGEPNPAYPAAGPLHVYPERPATVPAKAKAKSRNRRRARKGKARTTYSQDVLKGSEGCEGSWFTPLEDSVAMPTKDNGYQESGVCYSCGERVKLTPDGLIELHWEGVAA